MRPVRYRAVGAAIAALAAVSAFLFLDGQLCPIKASWGIPCPSCGMTRAWLALFSGHPGEAFMWHPLFGLPAVAIPAAWLLRSKPKASMILAVGVAVAFLAVWAVRMVLMFPGTPPMDLYRGAWAFRLFEAARGAIR
jgi:hypothetical protein